MKMIVHKILISLVMSLLTVPAVKNSAIYARICFIFLWNALKQILTHSEKIGKAVSK